MAKQLDQNAVELGQHVQKILKQFQLAHSSAANEPHVCLNHQELRVVELLGNDGSQIMRSIAEHLSLAVNSVTSVVDGLERKELVHRQRSSDDRRLVHVQLTEAGREAWKAAEQSKLDLYRSMLAPLSRSERENFLTLFRKIAQVNCEAVPQASR